MKRHAILAARARRDAERYQRRYPTNGDAEFARTICRDVAAIRAVADLIEAGQLDAAYRRAARLDTVVRDAFSMTVWSALSKDKAFGHEGGWPVKLRDLIKQLTDIAADMESSLGADVEAEVVAAYQPAHPLTGTIEGVAAPDEGDDGEPLLVDGRPIVWIVVGGHPGGFPPYAPNVVWEAI